MAHANAGKTNNSSLACFYSDSDGKLYRLRHAHHDVDRCSDHDLRSWNYQGPVWLDYQCDSLELCSSTVSRWNFRRQDRATQSVDYYCSAVGCWSGPYCNGTGTRSFVGRYHRRINDCRTLPKWCRPRARVPRHQCINQQVVSTGCSGIAGGTFELRPDAGVRRSFAATRVDDPRNRLALVVSYYGAVGPDPFRVVVVVLP